MIEFDGHRKGFVHPSSTPSTRHPPVRSDGGLYCLEGCLKVREELQASSSIDFAQLSTEKSAESIAVYSFLTSPFPPVRGWIRSDGFDQRSGPSSPSSRFVKNGLSKGDVLINGLTLIV
jgi:hypothetical protein